MFRNTFVLCVVVRQLARERTDFVSQKFNAVKITQSDSSNQYTTELSRRVIFLVTGSFQ